MILDEILAAKREEIKELKEKFKLPLEQKKLPKVRNFEKAIKGRRLGLIAEVKASSPSAGTIVKDYDPVSIARIYENAGVNAVSVLTDRKYFSGSIDHLVDVRKAVKLPLLRKDFIIDASQIFESRLAGADAVLLIARILGQDELENLIRTTQDLGMTPLVEVHSVKEAQSALDAGARVIGINNRDLNTLKVDLSTTVNIMNELPQLKKKVLISESGIREKADVDLLRELGINAILVGEAILQSSDIRQKIKELLG